jgi:two-component system sensor histidine kinase UhpB
MGSSPHLRPGGRRRRDTATPVGDAGRVLARLPLYWQVCLINGLVFVVATVTLAVSPARVSAPVLPREWVVLLGGLVVMLVTNAVLLRASLRPVDRVVHEMESVDHLHTGDRLPEVGEGPGGRLVASYNAMLDRLDAERSTSTARAVAAQEAERHRIAQELHDQVGQDLTVVLLGLSQLEQRVPADVAGEVTLLRDSARSSLDDVRRVARELRPGVLDDLGLASALAAMCSDLAVHAGVPVRRTVSPGLPDLGPDRELVVYRVAQEALTNAARHARAGELRLSLARVGGAVVLEVSDDGRPDGPIVPGSGLLGMRERASLVGATVRVDSGQRGTTVRLELPLGEATA